MTAQFFEVEFFKVVGGVETFERMTVRAVDEVAAVDEVRFSRTPADSFKCMWTVRVVDEP